MTTIDDRIRNLAAILINAEEIDSFELIIELRPALTPRAFATLCLAADLCPIHETDLDSCADDDLDCPYREDR